MYRKRAITNARGGVVVMLALSLAVILGMGALAVDLGVLFKMRGDAQRAADAAALAGASAYLDCTTPFPAIDSAKHRAKVYAAQNHVGRLPIDTTEVEDQPLLFQGEEITVQVIPDEFKVRVWITRDSLTLYFAPILNVFMGEVGARAAAEAAEAGAIRCLKPWAIPDQGYTEDDIGKLDTLKIPSDEPLDVEDSWFYAIRLPPHDPDQMTKTSCAAPKGESPSQGTEQRWGTPADGCTEANIGTGSCWYRSYICNDNCGEVTLDQDFTVEKGNMIGPTAQGVNDLLMSDPGVYFDENTKQLMRDGEVVKPEDTGRAIKVGLYNPGTYTHPDQYTIRLTGFAYFFLEDGPHTYKGREGLYDPDQAESIVGRFLYYAPGSGGGPSTTPFARLLRLVE